MKSHRGTSRKKKEILAIEEKIQKKPDEEVRVRKGYFYCACPKHR